MKSRRTHSSIDALPKEVKKTVNLMITDGQWPDDRDGQLLAAAQQEPGKPTYDKITEYLNRRGYQISRSALGRYAGRIGMMSKMRYASSLAREVMADQKAHASETQKAVAEMITAHIIDIAATGDQLSPKDLQNISRSLKDCAAIAIKADQYIRERVEERAAAAAENIQQYKQEIPEHILRSITEQVYGIVQVDDNSNK